MNPQKEILSHKKALTLIIIVITLTAFSLCGWLIWPTPYTEESINMSMFGRQQIRTERLTGTKQINTDGKWYEIDISPDGKIDIPEGTPIRVK